MKNSWTVLSDKIIKNVGELEDILIQNRGINNIDAFFSSELDLLEDPSNFYQIDIAVKRILEAVKTKEKIYIHGDYDADGIIATSILFDYLYRQLGADVTPLIPDREDEGYGVSEESIERLGKSGKGLVITVDCGIKDSRVIDKLSKEGFDFIITDHHEFEYDQDGNPVLPTNSIVIHANHPKSTFKFANISGAATAWKLVWAIDKKVKNSGLSNVKKYLDLVSITTVTDIMPLIEENRVILKAGLEMIKDTQNIGLRDLILESKLEIKDIEAYHYGFVIGPKINASGRIGNPLDAVRLFTTNDALVSKKYASKLNYLNQDRQKITTDIFSRIEGDIASEDKIIIIKEDINEGVIGLIAGRITDNLHKPSIVFTTTSEGNLKGSARSIKDIHIVEELNKVKDLIIKYGGHSGAAGLTIKESDYDKLKENLIHNINQYSDDVFEKLIRIDCELNPSIVSVDLINEIDKFKPFGYKNNSPYFLLRKMKLVDISEVGRERQHTKMTLDNGDLFHCIGFNIAKTTSGYKVGDILDIVFTPQINEWNGRKTINLRILDTDYS